MKLNLEVIIRTINSHLIILQYYNFMLISNVLNYVFSIIMYILIDLVIQSVFFFLIQIQRQC